MGFSIARQMDDGRLVGGYATIWKVEDKGKYSSVQLSTSRKKEDGSYETDFSSYVNFVGAAHTMAQGITQMTRIQIKNADVTKRYDKAKDKEYVNFAVFDFDILDQTPAKKYANKSATPTPKKVTGNEDFMNVPNTEEDELPW